MGIVQEPRIRGTSATESHYQAKTSEDSRLKDLVRAVVSVQKSESAVTICTILTDTKYPEP
jgi:hypothetical protein